MTKISKSPDRYTFQKDNYVKRQEEQGLEPLEEYIEMFKTWKQQDEENMVDPDWQKDNLEYDLRSTEWILEKVRGSDVYAQNLYAAMCNNQFTKREMWPILKDQRWSCSWRHAGGIIADMREEGDYIDWYCSGIKGDMDDIDYEAALAKGFDIRNYVSESHVTDEIKDDLYKLGWLVAEYKDDE